MKTALIALALALAFSLNAQDKDTRHLLILEEIQKSIQNDFDLQEKIKVVKSAPAPISKKREMSVGEKKIQEQLEKNRLKIQKMRGTSKGPQLSGKEKIRMMLEKNRQKIKARKTKKTTTDMSEDWISKAAKNQRDWLSQQKQSMDAWERARKEELAKWEEDAKKFLKRIPIYKENLVSFEEDKEKEKTQPVKKPKPRPQVTTKEVIIPVFQDFHIIDQAFSSSVKDQGSRPTCAAFAGTRALEIVLAKTSKPQELSEQYFFWSSKPDCQDSPCPKQGSWVRKGYQSSKEAPAPDIPLAKDCKYNKDAQEGNVTQTPLPGGCYRGRAKVESYYKVKSMPEIVKALSDGHPVVGGFKLSKNFYRNNGYVFLQDVKDSTASLDSHAKGHAILLVGYMKLPEELHQKEGTFCLISANSWGVGWGKGGHACISEKWLNKYRFDMAFLALESVR